MRGRYAGVSMRAHRAMLPGAARLARLPAEPSPEAKRRMTVVKWYLEHSSRLRLTARHFGFSPDTIRRWVDGYARYGPSGLENGSRRPRNVRQPQTPPDVLQRILELREENPGMGREKLHRLLLREGISISPKGIDRTIARLKARGLLREPRLQRKSPKPHLKRLRRPPDLMVEQPGALVQMDTKYVPLPNGKTVFQFGAIDCFTRKRVVDLAPSLASEEGARFLRQVISGFPFPVQAIQSDGGPEFLGHFTKTVAELQLTHYFNRPYYPQGNGRIERSFRTDDDEFYHVYDLPADFGGLKNALLAWNHRYESWRLHQALGYLTPDQFYQQWLSQQPQRKEAVSDMS
ncbi:MAG TPA: helix-turn-helix domain-containing protein [Anaerolineales bacterium]|nr:helix-turn-helix domain-containing protein [Anaerolineales bacterium]